MLHEQICWFISYQCVCGTVIPFLYCRNILVGFSLPVSPNQMMYQLFFPASFVLAHSKLVPATFLTRHTEAPILLLSVAGWSEGALLTCVPPDVNGCSRPTLAPAN
jgi:hypothetical protein